MKLRDGGALFIFLVITLAHLGGIFAEKNKAMDQEHEIKKMEFECPQANN